MTRDVIFHETKFPSHDSHFQLDSYSPLMPIIENPQDDIPPSSSAVERATTPTQAEPLSSSSGNFSDPPFDTVLPSLPLQLKEF